MLREAYMNKWRVWVARVGSVIRKSTVLGLELRLAREVEHNCGENDVHRPSQERHTDDDPEDGHGPERNLSLVASNGDERDDLAYDKSHNGGQEDDEKCGHHLGLDEVGAFLQSCEAVMLWFQNCDDLSEHEEQAKDEQADHLGEGVEEEEDDGILWVDERCEQSKGNGDGYGEEHGGQECPEACDEQAEESVGKRFEDFGGDVVVFFGVAVDVFHEFGECGHRQAEEYPQEDCGDDRSDEDR